MSDCINIRLADFGQKVVNESRKRPVIVDCWAPWCGPCQQLGPVLEECCARHAGAIRLAKVDTEAEPELAQQLAVSSIPDVRLFHHAKQVDRFVGFRPLDALMDWLRPHLPSAADEAIAAAERAIKERNRTQAFQRAKEAVRADHDNPRAYEVQIRAALLNQDHVTARAALSQLEKLPGSDRLVEQLAPLVEMASERFAYANVEAESLGGHYAKALGAIAKEQWATALEELLRIVEDDKDWEDGKARKRMLDIFTILGKGDEIAEDYRRKLALALF